MASSNSPTDSGLLSALPIYSTKRKSPEGIKQRRQQAIRESAQQPTDLSKQSQSIAGSSGSSGLHLVASQGTSPGSAHAPSVCTSAGLPAADPGDLSTSSLLSSLNPARFEPVHSVPGKLLADPDLYGNDLEQTTLYTIPEYIFICLDRIRATVEDRLGRSGPGRQKVMACCIDLGLPLVERHPLIQRLLTIYKEKDRLSEDIGVLQLDGLHDFLSVSSLSIPNETGTRYRKRQNLYLPQYINMSVRSLSSQLEVSSSFISTVAIMVVLSSQNCIFEGHQHRLRRALKSIFDAIKLRVRFAEILIEAVKESKNVDNDDWMTGW